MALVLEIAAPRVNTEVVEQLEALLKMARSGELRGISVLANGVTNAITLNVGEWSAPAALYAFECWKHRTLHTQQSDLPEG